MYKDFRYVNAGTNEFHRWGGKAQEKVRKGLEPNSKGFLSIPADGGKYYTIGTSNGAYGEFAKFDGTFFSVNSAGYVWVKVGSAKEDAYRRMLNRLIEDMKDKRGY